VVRNPYCGLYRWRSGKLTHYTVAQGLASSGIYELLEDRNNNLWMSGPNGISVISRPELDAVGDQPARSVSLVLYGVSDGWRPCRCMAARSLPASHDRGRSLVFQQQRPVRVLSISPDRLARPPW